jgi:hypothetical protein
MNSVIQIWFNPGMMQYEMYVNGIAVSTMNIRVDSKQMDMPAATITAQVAIVNEQPKAK